MSVALSFGRWGGFYVHFGYTWRVCLGWVSLTVFPRDLDDILAELTLGLDEIRVWRAALTAWMEE